MKKQNKNKIAFPFMWFLVVSPIPVVLLAYVFYAEFFLPYYFWGYLTIWVLYITGLLQKIVDEI